MTFSEPQLGQDGIFALLGNRLFLQNYNNFQLRSQDCHYALRTTQVAKAAFDSDAFYLFGPPPLPKDLPSQLVLKPRDGDISGGVGIEADKDVFEELPIDRRSIYWQKTAADGHRFVAQDIAFNWRGDRYSLFAVSDATSSDEFLADLRGNSATRKFVPIIEERFRPPLIFRNRASGRYWFIQPGEPGDFLVNWHVYVAEPSGVTLRCMVQFRPDRIGTGLERGIASPHTQAAYRC